MCEIAKYAKLLPLLLALALLAGMPAAVSGQEALTVQIVSSTYTVSEGDGTVGIAVEISESPSSDVVVGLVTTDGEAVRGWDYGRDEPVTFLAGTTTLTQTIRVTIVDDNILEPPETFFVEISSSAAHSVARHPVTIQDNDETTLGFSVDEYRATEGGSVQVCIEQSGRNDVPFAVSISYSDPDGALTSGQTIPSSVTFSERSPRQCFNVSVNQVSSVAVAEFTITGVTSNSPGVANRVRIGGRSATVRVYDTGVTPVVVQFSASEYTVNEGDGTVAITLTISQSSSLFPVTVLLRTSDRMAVAGRDFEHVVIRVTFPAGTTTLTQTVNAYIINDITVENRETFTVALERTSSLDSSVTIPSATATVEITDDDTATMGFQQTSYRIDESTRHGGVQVCWSVSQPTASCPVQFPFTVQLLTEDGTAVSPTDYTALDAILPFSVCQRTQCVSIPIINDSGLEDAETFTVRLERTSTLPAGITLSPDTTTVEIQDNDAAIVDFESDEYTITEGGSLDIGVELRSTGDCPVDFGFDIRLGSSVPTGARPYISGIPSLVSFKRCDKNVLTSVSTSDIEATAELRFALEPPSNLDPRIYIRQPTAAAYVIDQGGATEAFEDLSLGSDDSPWGIWSDEQTLWVSIEGDAKIYGYDMDTKARGDSGQDFDTLDADNDRPTGIWSNGSTMWVADYDGEIYAYQMSDKARDFDGDFDTLSVEGNANPTGLWSNGTTLWVADDIDDKIYAYDIATKARDSTKEFNGLDSENSEPAGIWSDRRTMWVADQTSDKIYAYDMATKARVEEKEFNALPATVNDEPRGIWSDGQIMWVVDKGNDEVYAYYFPAEPDVPVPVRRTSTTTTGASPEIEETDAARPSTISAQCISEEADEDSVDIELGITIADSWVSGCPSITRGGRLAKYYSFNLPITTAVEIALDSHLDDYLVLRRGGLSGKVVEQDDDSGPGNNSLISETLTAGKYTIEATTFYADGVEAAFTLSVKAISRILYEGPVSEVSRAGYGPAGPNMTVKLLPTRPMGTLEITIEDADGFGEGAGPLGGAQAEGGSAGTMMLALPKTSWVQYGGITVETRESESWTAHTTEDEQAMLTRGAAGPDLSPVLLGLVQLLGKVEGALQLLQSLAGLSSPATDTSPAEPDESVLDTIFQKSYANCVSQVTVPWLVDAEGTTGVRISVPVTLADTDYLSLASSFVASNNQPALAQLHNLLNTCIDVPACQRPEPSAK